MYESALQSPKRLRLGFSTSLTDSLLTWRLFRVQDFEQSIALRGKCCGPRVFTNGTIYVRTLTGGNAHVNAATGFRQSVLCSAMQLTDTQWLALQSPWWLSTVRGRLQAKR